MKARTLRCRLTLAAIMILFILSAPAQAQFETDRSYIGAHIGLGSYESSISFGGDFEYAMTAPGEAGPGRIGIGGTVDYWSWSGNDGNNYYWSYSWVPIGLYGAYHFVIPNKRWDLFAGLGLGYIIVNASWHRPDGGTIETTPTYGSHIYWSGVAGVRYFFSPSLALHSRLGWGASVLSVGLNLTL